MRYIRQKLSSDNVSERLLCSSLLLFVLFFSVMTISYYLLPEGILRNKNPLQDWETSSSSVILAQQIFFYNMLSVIVIAFASLFGSKKELEAHYLSLGYWALFAQISINAVVLGTWSFSMGGDAVPYFGRIVRTFDLAHRAGLWEMTGQMFIACSLAQIAIVRTSGRETDTRKLSSIRLRRSEAFVLIIGLILMAIGAVVESVAINSL